MSGTSGLLASTLDLAGRSTILLAVVLGAWGAFGRRRPMLGAAIGQAGLLGLLILPAAATLGPPLAIPLLGAPATPSPRVEPARAPEPDRAIDAGFPPPGPAPATFPLPAIKIPARPVRSPAPAPRAARPTIDGPAAVLGVYLLGVALLLGRLAGSLAGVGRLRRSGVAVDDPAWLDALAMLRGRVGVVRPVGLARSARVAVPVVVGWLRPTILLPISPGEGEREHAEAILLHELAHVARGDYAWNVALHLVGAVYWPQPLAWMLARALAGSRERACDAFCVHQMGGPGRYRAALLATAEGLARARAGPALGLAMARASRLGRRLAEIDRGRGEARCLPTRPARLAIAALGLTLAAALGPARITRAEARALPSPAPQEPRKPAEPARAPGAGRVLRVRVVSAATGRPVPRADFRLWLRLGPDDWRQADGEGRLDVAHSTGPDDTIPGFDVWGDGFAMQRHLFGFDPKVAIPEEVMIRLQPGESLGGMVQDEAGRPVAGAAVYLWSHNYKKKDPKELLYDLRAVTGPDGRWRTGGAPETTGEILGIYITQSDYMSDREYVAGRVKPPIADLRAGRAVSVMKKGVRIGGRILSADGRPVAGAQVISTDRPANLIHHEFDVRSDAEGRFRTGQVKPGDWHLVIRAPGFAPAARQVVVGAEVPDQEIRLGPPHPFRVSVSDPEGRPIAGAFVNIDRWARYRCLGVYLYTDADGLAAWDDAPGDEMMVNVDREGYTSIFDERVKAGAASTFVLRPALRIAGIVRDAETRKPIARAEVEYGAVDPKTGEVAVWNSRPAIGRVWFDQGRLDARFPAEADASKIRITAPGHEPFVSRPFRREEKVVAGYDIALDPGRGPAITVIRPDGRPLAGAKVIRGRPKDGEGIGLKGGQVAGESGGGQALTSAEGTFAIPTGDTPGLVLILGEDCYALASHKALAGSPRLVARPFGRVEGRLLAGNRPLANRAVEMSGLLMDESTSSVRLYQVWTATTDAEGRFAFDKVIPVSGFKVARKDREGTPGRVWSTGELVRVEDGRTAIATVGGKGRAIVGRVRPPEGWDRRVDFGDRASVRLDVNRANTPFPVEVLRGRNSLEEDDAWSRFLTSRRTTPEGLADAETWLTIEVDLAADGSFRIDDVPPGEYRLAVHVNERWFGGDRGPFAAIGRVVAIGPMPGGRSDDPVDLGVLRLRLRADLPGPGEPAPAFEVATVDGKRLAVPGDYRGRFLLLDFGAMADDQSRLQVVRMNGVFARSGKDPRFALLSLLVDPDRAESRAFVAGKGQPWPQAIVGAQGNPIADAYGFEPGLYPAAILIGPDGRVVARDLANAKIGEAVAAALGAGGPAPKP